VHIDALSRWTRKRAAFIGAAKLLRAGGTAGGMMVGVSDSLAGRGRGQGGYRTGRRN
jgi:hypothetical protein